MLSRKSWGIGQTRTFSFFRSSKVGSDHAAASRLERSVAIRPLDGSCMQRSEALAMLQPHRWLSSAAIYYDGVNYSECRIRYVRPVTGAQTQDIQYVGRGLRQGLSFGKRYSWV